MAQRTVLVPVHYPLKDRTVRALERAADLARERDADLSVFHVNLVHHDEDVSPDDLRDAVEAEIGPLSRTSYAVRDSFLLEETLLNEATQPDVTCVVVGKTTRTRWRQLLSQLLSTDVDVEAFLRANIDVEVVAV
jgi:K+-sensing histidine kinase KdpD